MSNDKSTIVNLLGDLGISPTQATIYEALLQMESGSIRGIAAQTGINRGTTYDCLKKLIVLGLVSVKQGGGREGYTAESPERIYEIIRDRRRDLLEASTLAKKILPQLVVRKKGSAGQPVVRYYEDDAGIVTVLKDVLQTCRKLPSREYLAYSSSPVRKYLYHSFPQFTKQRIADSIHVKVIAVGEGGEVAENSERKWLPDNDTTATSSYTLIYGDKVAVVSIAKDNTPYAVVIEDVGAASMQRLLFNQLWNYIA